MIPPGIATRGARCHIYKSMSDGRFAILDPAAGISGDMLLGALVAAGAPEAWLRGIPTRLGLADVHVEVRTVDRCGIRATKVDVLLTDGRQEGPSDWSTPPTHTPTPTTTTTHRTDTSAS